MSNTNLQHHSLENEYVSLVPMRYEHIKDLYKAGNDPSIWTWTTSNYCKTIEATESWVKSCLDNQSKGEQLPYVIVDKQTEKVVGSTSYLNIFIEHKAIEIGYTFINPQAQNTYVNRNCKLLLLSHAFESLHMNRVALQTHEKNQRSRNAILAIGAKFEGIQRWARIQADGSVRSSAFYSIIKPEWPQTKAQLIGKIQSNLKNNSMITTR